MKHILATLMLSMLFTSAMADDKAQPTAPAPTIAQEQDKSTPAPTEEKQSIVDYCRQPKSTC